MTAPKRIVLIGIFSALSLSLTQCPSTTTINSVADIVFPDSNVSFQRHVQPLLNLSCNFVGCHDSGGLIPLDSYYAMFRRAGLVIPLKPENSTVSQVINRTLGHRYAISSQINENHRKGVALWIKEGAKNN